MRDDAPVLRVAIVGLGPKGLFALERLLDRAAGLPPGARLQVDVFEAHPVPAAGPVYAPDQPPWLRMNNAAAHVDAWAPGHRTVPDASRRSFLEWSGAAGVRAGDFVPRALVGRYLADVLRTLLQHAPPSVDADVVAARVVGLRADGRRHLVLGAGDRPAYDEVLLATGHHRSSTHHEAPASDADAPVPSAGRIDAVFPIERLGPAAVPAGATVGVRGFALTFIDAALALTEGRGGRFVGDDPGDLRYEPGPDEVAAIVPVSRTGRPVLPKPQAPDPELAATIEALARRGRAAIRAEDPARRPADVLRRTLERTAAAILAAATATATAATATAATAATATAATAADSAAAADSATGLNAATAPDPAPGRPDAEVARALADDAEPPDAAVELRRALAVAVGRRPPDAAWALGNAWRALYPAIAATLADPRVTPEQWRSFRALAVRLERIAFGPSAQNAAKLLALVDHGVVDLTHVRGGRIDERSDGSRVGSTAGQRAVDVVVDAVLPAPGVPDAPGPLLDGLLRAGSVRRRPGRRGLDVDADATCLGRDGRPTRGLAAVGRPTEDAVIGNDTLTRTLHPDPDRWAARVLARCAAPLDPAPERQLERPTR